MGEALTKLLERTRQSLKTRIVSTASKPKEDFESRDRSINRPISNSMSKRFVQMAQIKKYYAEKISIRTIAKIVGVSKNTVKKYISLEEPPPKIPSRSNLTDYNEYVKSRLIQEPDLEIIKLWNEIREKGYKGCKSVFYDHLKGYRKGKRHPTISESSMPYWSARKVSLLLYRKMKQLTIAERKFVSELKKKSKDIRLASSYVNRFRELFDSTNGEGLQDWIDDLSCTNLKELKGFAKGLLSDITAVKNAISLPWSNGQVEGQINKLKTIKRQMYGRAGFNLLRKRLVLEIF
jgi:predicted transcriptional regulator